MTDRDNHPDSPPKADETSDVERAVDNSDAAQRGETKNQGSDGQ